jgi:hypothetical protein
MELSTGVIDTHRVAKDVSGKSFSLGKLLKKLGLPHEDTSLNNVGNDAYFALRAMLVLACPR